MIPVPKTRFGLLIRPLFKFLVILQNIEFSMDSSYTMSLYRFMYVWRMVIKHSSSTRSATQVRKWVISSVGLDSKDLACLYNRVNFKKYSSTHLLPCLKFINSSTLTSLFSYGNYNPKKASLNTSHSTGPDSTNLLSFHCVYHTWVMEKGNLISSCRLSPIDVPWLTSIYKKIIS